jgi:hypothetical protein
VTISVLLFYYQNHLQFLRNIPQIIPYFPLIGLVTVVQTVVKHISEFMKESAIGYDKDVHLKIVPYNITARTDNRRGYFLNVKKNRGKTAQNCHGLLKVKGTEIGDNFTHWYNTTKTHIDIDNNKNLKLFEISELNQNELVFQVVSDNGQRLTIRMSYDDSTRNKLDVTVGGDNTNTFHYSNNISDIIRKARTE